MAKEIIIAIICAAAAVLLGTEGMLTWIALSSDGADRPLIVAALIGVPAFITSIGTNLASHYLGAQSAKGATP